MDVELDPAKTVARIERNGGRLTLVLDDGVNRVRVPIPAETQENPYPYLTVSSFGWRVVYLATDVRRMSLLHLASVGT